MPYENIDGVLVWGEPDQPTVEQLKNCLAPGYPTDDDVAYRGALMADAHLGYSMPIGGVVAYRGWVSPSGVGYDIACGNKAAKTNLTYEQVKDDLPHILTEIQRQISFGMGRHNVDPVDEHPLFERNGHPGWDIPWINKLKRAAQSQLGTVGSGNHYVDILAEMQEDSEERDGLFGLDITDDSPIWIGVHFGSRGLGHKIATGFLALAKGFEPDQRAKGETMMDKPTMLQVGTELGDSYIAAMDLAGHYAYAGRDYVVDKVANILGAEQTFEVHNHHNYAWEEEIDGEKLWVVRKGATPAYPDQWGFIGGSMGDIAVIVKGVTSTEAQAALHSTVHGAGRIMSRTQAAGKLNYKTGQRAGGVVSQEAMDQAVRDFGVLLRGGGADESPQVYRKLADVLLAHRDSLEIVHPLKPIGVVMAGADVRDPYKD